MTCFRRAVALDPGFALAWYNRGLAAGLDFRDYRGGIADMERAIALGPELAFAPWLLLRFKLHACDWDGLETLQARLKHDVAAGKPMVDPLLFQLVSQAPAELRACATAYGNGAYPPRPPLWRPRRPGRIRLGYMSGDFGDHATSHLMAGLFECHDRARFEVWALDNSRPDTSALRRRLQAAFDHVLDIRALPDDAAAAAVAAAGIDILINVNGHAGEQRMGVAARRPAPLQVSYLGFPGTLGVPYTDYILADRVVIPPGEEGFYAEQVVTLPNSYQCNDHKRLIAPGPGRGVCGLPQKAVVFCNFNSSHKLTPGMFAAWMRIMAAVPDSVLWLVDGGLALAGHLRAMAAQAGVAPQRLVFAPNLPAARHLGRLGHADLCLDTLPYNAHTTGSDVLWAGVPLLTLRGTAFAGRVGASLLQAVGLAELVTENLQKYEALAIALAREPARLAALRQKLARNRHSTPLFDTAAFARDIETAYQTMWDIHCRGDAPRGFAVP